MNATTALANHDLWPELPLAAWQDTYSTLHMWTQIVGKVRLALSPNINHWWGVPLYVNAMGLTTSAIPYGGGNFEVQFDFIHHQLVIRTSNDAILALALAPRSVADFYREFMGALASLGIAVKIWKMPVEIPDPIPFDQDTKHASYDSEYVNRFWRILVSCGTVFKEFRAGFIGKASPVHFFWGSFDLAATRFSGRRAPERPGADSVTREAYSHEVISAGFWPGGGDIKGRSVLRVCRAGTGRICAASRSPGRGFLSSAAEGIYFDVRRRASRRFTARILARVFAKHV